MPEYTKIVTIEDMRYLARQRGGECISQNYKNAHTKLVWKCAEGHVFEATPGKVKQGRWCRECSRRRSALKRRTSIKEIKQIARSRNGKCLSEDYHPKEHLEWQCEYGHTWHADLHSVKSGSWCPVCGHAKSGRKRLTLEEMREIAASRGGKCLSDHYVNTDTKLKWQCRNGHVWEAIPSAVKKGHWCAACSGKQRLDIKAMQKIAHERGGKCISTEYKSVHRKLEWQCSEGHTWFATYGNISIGRWCPECSSGVGERICRTFFEQLFNLKFPKSRPSWLINQDGYQMELDGYCEGLGVAFEHQGRQHYHKIDRFYSSDVQFQKRKTDDLRKRMLCEQNRVILIEIPQIPDKLGLSSVQRYILEECRNRGIEIPAGADKRKVQLRSAFTPNAREKMRMVREQAIANGGVCLSTSYVGVHEKLRFRCHNNHEWETTPWVVLKGHWCPTCGASERGSARRLTIEEIQRIAEERGGRCVSEKYINANTHLLWECSKGHTWRAIPNSIKRGSWCPICSKEKRRSEQNP